MERLQKTSKEGLSYKNLRWWASAGLIVIVATVLIGVSIAHNTKNSSFFPDSVRSSVNFPLYYPSNLPKGYTYDKSGTFVSNKTLFFNIRAGGRVINIAEQALPSRPPDLEALKKLNPSFKDLYLDSGNAISGIDSASRSPTVIIETNTTLISIQATINTPSDQVVDLAKHLRSVAN